VTELAKEDKSVFRSVICALIHRVHQLQ
jgi:hypothetical protein